MSWYNPLFNRVQNINNLLIPLVIKQEKMPLQRGEISEYQHGMMDPGLRGGLMVETSFREAFPQSSFKHRHASWRGRQGPPGGADISWPCEVNSSKSGLPETESEVHWGLPFALGPWGTRRIRLTLSFAVRALPLEPLARGSPDISGAEHHHGRDGPFQNTQVDSYWDLKPSSSILKL